MRIICGLMCAFSLLIGSAAAQEKLTLDELISKHLASVGGASERTAIKGRAITGKCTFDVIQGGTGSAEGKAGIISVERQLKFMTKLNSPRFPDERFWYSGKKAIIPTSNTASRTLLGDFLYRNDSILRDGLFSGVLSTAWPFFSNDLRGAKLTLDGLKNVDGHELWQVTYVPKKSASELVVHLFFDPQSFQHVQTAYSFTVAPYHNVSPGQRNDITGITTQRSDTVYTVLEKFADFRTVDGITLPSTWVVSYTVEPTRVQALRWTMSLERPTSNPQIDPQNVFPEN